MRLPPLTSIPPEIACAGDYEPLARERMAPDAWAYVAGGAGDEITLRRNRVAFDELRLRGRILADLRGGNTRLELFGQRFDSPLLLAPVAYLALAHPEGERAAIRGALAAGAGAVLSCHATLTLEAAAREAAAGGAPSDRERLPRLWFQLYPQPDRAVTEAVIRRAENAGYSALVVTLDAPVNGNRRHEQRSRFALPAGLEAASLRGYPPPARGRGGAGQPLCGGILELAPTWQDLAWLRASTRLPLLLKGIMDPEDAARAVEGGVDGLVVSNHGGRMLDTMPAAIEALPAIAAAVGGRVPLLLDSGIRQGTDILKALALGASAVLIGRPYLWALAAAGATGVAHVVQLLRAELEVAMALTGCRDLAAIRQEARIVPTR